MMNANTWATVIQGLPHLNASAKLLLLTLASKADDSGNCTCTYNTLMREAGLGSRATVARGLSALAQAGVVDRRRGQHGVVYHLLRVTGEVSDGE